MTRESRLAENSAKSLSQGSAFARCAYGGRQTEREDFRCRIGRKKIFARPNFLAKDRAEMPKMRRRMSKRLEFRDCSSEIQNSCQRLLPRDKPGDTVAENSSADRAKAANTIELRAG